MTEKERLEVIKHSYEVLQGLVKDLSKSVKDAQEGIDILGPKPHHGKSVRDRWHRRAD